MLRIVLLVVTVVFTALIATLTALDMVDHGVSWLDVLALLVVALFATGIVGSLWEMGRR
jgi:hypothetical protein